LFCKPCFTLQLGTRQRASHRVSVPITVAGRVVTFGLIGETTFPTRVQISEFKPFLPIKTFQDLFENLAVYKRLTYD
jgi:hypothetical protein